MKLGQAVSQKERKYPPAEPVALRLLAPQRGLIATVGSGSVWISIARMISVQPNDVVDTTIHISDHRALPKEPDDGKEFLIRIDVVRNCYLQTAARQFFAARAVFVCLLNIKPSAFPKL